MSRHARMIVEFSLLAAVAVVALQWAARLAS